MVSSQVLSRTLSEAVAESVIGPKVAIGEAGFRCARNRISGGVLFSRNGGSDGGRGLSVSTSGVRGLLLNFMRRPRADDADVGLISGSAVPGPDDGGVVGGWGDITSTSG